MKIPDLSEVTGKNDGSRKPKNVDLGKYRKKKRSVRSIIRLIILLAVLAALVFVWFNADTIFEPLRGIASRVETKTTTDVGFPIELPGSSEYSIMKFGDAFSLLTDTYLYAYSTDGAQLYALKHNYANPMQAVSDKRVLLYDKAAYTFAAYSRSSLIYQKQLDDKIVYASVGEDGLAAIVTESERYSDVLYIYDDGGNWKYTKKFADENVMQVCSIGNGEHIIVSTLSAKHGDMLTNFYCFSIKATEGFEWKYSLRGNSLPCGMYADKSVVTAVCDNAVIVLDTATGELAGTYDFTGELRHFYMNGERTIVHYNDISANRNVVLSLNSKAEANGVCNVSAAASCVFCDKSGVYVLDGARLKVFDNELINENDIQVSDDDYSSFVKIGRSAFLLGYETLNSVAVEDAPEPQTGIVTPAPEPDSGKKG
ncbi:MAG: hypothetical protein IK990_00200 [Ruminiclostridium sp.]|nr:hypothetical protein [Ruminiclostridium sp.]